MKSAVRPGRAAAPRDTQSLPRHLEVEAFTALRFNAAHTHRRKTMRIEIYGLSDDELHVHVDGQLRHQVTMFSGARYVGALDVRSIANASGDTRALRVHAIYDEGWSFAAGRVGEFCPIPDGWSVRVEPEHVDRPHLVIDTGDELVQVTHRGDDRELDDDHPGEDEDVAGASSRDAPLDLAAAQDVADHLAAHAPWVNAHVTLRRAVDEIRRLRAQIDTPAMRAGITEPACVGPERGAR